MKRPILFPILGAALTLGSQVVSHAANLTFIDDIPITDVLLSRGDKGGNTGSQQAFGYRQNAADGTTRAGTRGRGSSFIISSSPGASYDISSLSVSMSTSGDDAGYRPDGDLHITVFEWDNPTNPDDDVDWKLDTGASGGTQVFSGTFALDSGTALLATQLMSISFDPAELTIDDGKAYAFFVRYTLDNLLDEFAAPLDEDVSIAFDTDTPNFPDGLLLSTNPETTFALAANGASGSRDLNYFITGTVTGGLVPSAISTTTNPINLGESLDLNISFDPTADTAILTTPSGAVDVLVLDDGVTNGDLVASDGMVVVNEMPAATFTYGLVATKTALPDSGASLLVVVANPSEVTVSDTAPTSGLISSSPTGGTDTSLFDEDADDNHGRGQLFNLPDGPSPTDQYEITAVTVRKSNAQAYANDTITLYIFEGTQADWDAGTGHDTPTDGSNYYVDTTVTPLASQSYNLSGTIVNDDYVTFTLTTPLLVDEDSDFGFFMIYDQGESDQSRFRHNEAGAGGGRLSVEVVDHSSTPIESRKMHYFVHGTAFGVDPIDPMITSISADGSTPPEITIEMLGDPGTTYDVTASTGLVEGFSDIDVTISTDGLGVGSVTFSGVGTKEFYRVETQ